MPDNLSTLLLAGLVIAIVVLIVQFASARQHCNRATKTVEKLTAVAFHTLREEAQPQ